MPQPKRCGTSRHRPYSEVLPNVRTQYSDKQRPRSGIADGRESRSCRSNPPVPECHRTRYAHARHDRGAGPGLDRFSHLLGRRLHHAAQPLESQCPDLLDRRHGDGHGPGHRHAQHRSVRGLAARRPRHDHGRHAGRDPAAVHRFRQPLHVGDRPRHRPSGGRGDRRASWRRHRLSQGSGLYCHARRLSGLARRCLVDHDRSYGCAHGPGLRPDGRWSLWFHRGDGQLGRCHRGLCLHRLGAVFGPQAAPALQLPAASHLGRSHPRQSGLRPDADRGLGRQCL